MTHFRFLIIIMTITILLGCIGQVDSYSSIGFDSNFQETPEYTSKMTVKDSEEPIRFRGIIFLEEGSCSLRIIKPDGTIAKEYSYDSPGPKNLIADFKAMDGRWKLELTSREAEGSYRIEWSNKDNGI